MANLKNLVDEYESLFEREKQINEELSSLLSARHINQEKFDSLKSMFPNVQIMHNDSVNLLSMISFTASLADNVSSKVRQLDIAKGRVIQCIKRVTDILDLKACTDGVTEALSEEDYETAANHIHRYLNLDKESFKLKSEFSVDLNEKTYLDHSFKLLQDARLKLQEIVKEKYDQALAANDIPQLERFFKIFPLIGEAENGLVRFSAYLCSQISEAAERNFQLMTFSDPSDSRFNVMFADGLIMLFEKVARVIEAYQPVIETYYGHGHMFLFIKNIQKECDRQSVRILDKFKQVRKLNSIFNTVQQTIITNYTGGSGGGGGVGGIAGIGGSSVSANLNKLDERLDPRDLDDLLTELTLISARSELYKNFLFKSIQNDLNGADQVIKSRQQQQQPTMTTTTATGNKPLLIIAKNLPKMSEVQTFINNCQLRCAMQELIGQYSTIENYFMTENMHKAIQMDTTNPGSLTSSVVDDTFFIIKKCIKRSMCSDNVDGCCAMFNNCSSALDSLYRDYFYSKLKLGFPSGFDLTQAYTAIQRRFQNAEQMEKEKLSFITTLNNIDESTELILTIKKLFEEDVSKLFATESQQSKDKLSSCLNELSSVSTRFKDLLEFGFKEFNTNDIKPRIKQLCDIYLQLNHKLSEEDFQTSSSSDPFIQNFIKSLDQMLASVKDRLSAKNQDTFTNLMAMETAAHLEKNIYKCSYNKYGGLQLDNEIRVLINYLTSITSWSSREKFARLSQIAILLGLDNLNEIFDYWNSPLTITWRLTPNEIRQILSLRSDFRSEEIRSLKL